MERYYFHIRQDQTLFEDKQGAEFADFQAAWAWALQDARILIRQNTVDGPNECKWVEIADRSGAVVASLPFSRALLH